MSKNLKVADILYGGVSETGSVREDNQDSILLPDRILNGAFVSLAGVADGMGGYASGDIASSLALATFRQAVVDTRGDAPPEKTLKRAMEAANLDVYKVARELGAGRMGTTLTVAYISGEIVHFAHIGDSRAYLVREGVATCLTNDHSVVGDLVRSRLITPEKVRTHAQRSILTHAVGLELFARPDITQHKLMVGDQLVLCSDGVWSVVEDHEIASIAATKNRTPAELSQQLVDYAIDQDSDDNCSVVIVKIRGFTSVNIPEPENERRKWFGFSF